MDELDAAMEATLVEDEVDDLTSMLSHDPAGNLSHALEWEFFEPVHEHEDEDTDQHFTQDEIDELEAAIRTEQGLLE